MHAKLIKDAIHDSIELSEAEMAVIDHPLFQRLRFVKQLSTAYLVYPSALHTRFEHSLGAMHLTGLLARQLGFSKEKTQVLRLAAFLHDVGHGAFAHISDPVLKELTGMEHERRGIELIKRTDLGATIEENGVSINELSKLMEGREEGAIITRDLGTDRIDYLLRDAHFTGVTYSTIDADRLIRTLAYRKGELYVEERGVLSAENLLVARHFMFKAVYYHPTVRISGEMVDCAIRQGLEENWIEPEDVALGTDERLLAKLAEQGSNLAARLMFRKLYKAALVIEPQKQHVKFRQTIAKQGYSQKLLNRLNEKARLKKLDAIISMPDERSSKFTVKIIDELSGNITTLDKESGLVRALESEGPQAPLIIACKPEARSKCAKAARQLVGFSSH